MTTTTETHPADAVLEGTRWRIDPAHSSAEFEVPHLFGLHAVKGGFHRFDGTLDLTGSPAIEMTIDATSVDTGVALRDKHLRQGHYFDVEQHPQVRFVSDSVTLDGERLSVRGQLRAAGKSTPLELTAKLRRVGDALEVEATTEVDQRRLGMPSSAPGGRGATRLAVRGRLVRDAPRRSRAATARPRPGSPRTFSRRRPPGRGPRCSCGPTAPRRRPAHAPSVRTSGRRERQPGATRRRSRRRRPRRSSGARHVDQCPPAVTTLISLVIPPTPATTGDGVERRIAVVLVLDLALQGQPAGGDGDVDLIVGDVAPRHERLQRGASDLLVLPVIARVDPQVVRHGADAVDGLGDSIATRRWGGLRTVPRSITVPVAFRDRHLGGMGKAVVGGVPRANLVADVLLVVHGKRSSVAGESVPSMRAHRVSGHHEIRVITQTL